MKKFSNICPKDYVVSLRYCGWSSRCGMSIIEITRTTSYYIVNSACICHNCKVIKSNQAKTLIEESDSEIIEIPNSCLKYFWKYLY